MLKDFKSVFPNLLTSRFVLSDLEDFPYDVYDKQMQMYQESENWYKGDALEDQGKQGRETDLYPMRINPLKATVLKHAYTVFGEVENDGRPLVVTKMIPSGVGGTANSKEAKQAGKHAEEVLNLVWWENAGRDLMMRNSMMSQIYGGCIFKATYVPWEGEDMNGFRQIPIRIEAPNPKTFIGVPDASDYYRLAECWLVREIDEDEARRWGFSFNSGDQLWYNEHWTRDSYTIQINNTLLSKNVRGIDVPLGGVNPFGVVPAVYIPHIRDIDFLGSNAFDHLRGYVKELNLRFGDYGDATNDDAHPLISVRDVTGSIQVKRINDWLEVIDLGQTGNITGNEHSPEMEEVRSQHASAAMKDQIQSIWTQYERDSFVPAVAYGEDEGSQRSGMTLAMRFWPLGSHITTERYFWTSGLDIFQAILLRMMRTKELMQIKEIHTRMRMKQVWAPLLPRDREADVQEWAQRAGNEIASIEHLLELAGDVEDIPEERARILAWQKDLEDIKAQVANKYAMLEQEAQAKADLEQTKVQGESQIAAADVQAKAFAQRQTVPPGGTKPKPKSNGGDQ